MSANLDEPTLSEKMLHDMFCGALAGGTWLKQIELEDRYRVSRTMVRRALDELTARRYVEHIPNRGYRVALQSQDRRAELREIRLVLEVHAAAGIVENAPSGAHKQLRRLARRFDKALETGTLTDQVRANADFHEYLYSLSPNRTLFEELMEMRRRAAALVPTPWSSVREMRRASDQHFEMVDALKKRDVDAMGKAIARHISRSADSVAESRQGDSGRIMPVLSGALP